MSTIKEVTADGKTELVVGNEPLKKEPSKKKKKRKASEPYTPMIPDSVAMTKTAKQRWEELKKELKNAEAFMDLKVQEGDDEQEAGMQPQQPDSDGQPSQADSDMGAGDDQSQVEQGGEEGLSSDEGNQAELSQLNEQGDQDAEQDLSPEEAEQQLVDALKELGHSDAEIAHIVHGHTIPQPTKDDYAAQNEMMSGQMDQALAQQKSQIEHKYLEEQSKADLEHKKRMQDVEFEERKQNMKKPEDDSHVKEHDKKLQELEYEKRKREIELELAYKEREMELKLKQLEENHKHKLEQDKASHKNKSESDKIKHQQKLKEQKSLKKSDDDVTIPKDEFTREHEHLVEILDDDDSEEAKEKKEQQKELDEVKKDELPYWHPKAKMEHQKALRIKERQWAQQKTTAPAPVAPAPAAPQPGATTISGTPNKLYNPELSGTVNYKPPKPEGA